MARIYEYQGKEILKKAGVSIPRGVTTDDPKEAGEAAFMVGKPVALKAQILITGRYKAGGIKFVENSADVEHAASELIGSIVKGLKVKKILVEEKISIQKEFFVSIIINNSYKVKAPTLIFSTEGGVDIEEVAKDNPEKIGKLDINYLTGLNTATVESFLSSFEEVQQLTLPAQGELADVICKLYKAFCEKDLRIAEINPLVLDDKGHFIAGDCRFTIDDNSVFRRPEFEIDLPRDMDREATALEKLAWSIEEGDFRGTGYFAQMYPEIVGTGYIGFHGIGGGGAMLAASALVNSGFKIANYADTSGDPPASKIYRVIKCILMQPIEAYVLMGACLANQEQWHHAHAIVKALREEAEKTPGFPVVLLIAGNKEKEAHSIIRKGLEDVDLHWELYGREHIYDTDFITGRVQKLIESYRMAKEGEASCH